MSFLQKIFRFFVSRKSFELAKTASQSWFFQCECGHKDNIWESGGIRYKAKGKPVMACRCTACQKTSVRKLQKNIISSPK